MPRVTALVACGILLATPVSGQAPAPLPIHTIPPAERLVPRPLAVTLRANATRLPFGQAPALTLVVRNSGVEPLLLHPAAVSNLRIYNADGRLVAPFSSAIFEYIAIPLRRRDLIVLPPGATHRLRVRTEFHSRSPSDGVSMYWRQSPGGSEEFPLPPGDYSLRFTYISYPDYGVAYDMPPPLNVWYGRIEAPPIPFTVLPPGDAQLRGWIASIEGAAAGNDAIAAVQAQRVAAAIDPLLRRFERVAADRPRIVEAITSIDGGRGVPRLLELIAALPERERLELLVTPAFMTLGREGPTCSVPLMIQAIERSPSAIEATLGPQPRLADRCPLLAPALREVIRSPLVLPDTPGGWAAYPRGGVIDALGWSGDRSDVPLLDSVLDRSLPGLPVANAAAMDILRQAAAKALGRIGGAGAGRALVRELRDPVRNRNILLTLEEEATRLRADGAAEVLLPLLASANDTVVTRAVQSLQQLGAREAVPALQQLMNHGAPIVREYAINALLALGAPVATTVVLPDESNTMTTHHWLMDLVRRGQPSDLPRFVAAVVSGPQYVRDAGVEGVEKFGTADTYPQLRAALAQASPANTGYVRSALSQLTFMPIWGPRELVEWDTWWKRQAGRTREDWAQDALDRTSRGAANANASFTAKAIRYFATVNALSEPRIEQALATGGWFERSAVADALAPERPARAAAIYLAELESRYLGACGNAARKLAALAGEKVDVDCTVASERQQAIARWTRLLLPR